MTVSERTVAVLPFDPVHAPPEQRRAVGQLRADSAAHDCPEDPLHNPDQAALELTLLLPDERAEYFVVWEGERAVGLGGLSYDLQQNTHLAQVRLVVHPQFRRRGLGRALTRALEAAARRLERPTLTFATTSLNPAGEAYARVLGAQAALTLRQTRLDLAGIPQELRRAWQARPENDPYRLHAWDGPVPEGFLERMADVMMVMNTAPRGDLDMNDWRITPEMIRAWEANLNGSGEVRHLLVLEDTRSGELMGYSEVFWSPERASIVHQGATAVRPQARGQGLGKWLKAAMLDRVEADCPGAREIRTGNAEQNAAMRGINAALGFAPFITITEWQLRLQ
ncbi:GNAT family N-acetyltransferase [Deinococcus aerophilus]|uniref:GNAT family N-acetyltransferase n=1 Tax=Deinococcus aerophilus TaxID=522488 RepID=A0ABQ2GNQ1_9DEIO|nr:GNAT family N-acetyltransferase [Deinococcus aerophilus]GGM03353.1 GNAT family N-acetyltransferase [Deinococcus aerophilus]